MREIGIHIKWSVYLYRTEDNEEEEGYHNGGQAAHSFDSWFVVLSMNLTPVGRYATVLKSSAGSVTEKCRDKNLFRDGEMLRHHLV